jgi:hypothetical protein
VGLVHLVYLVCFVCLVILRFEPNKRNKPNEPHRRENMADNNAVYAIRFPDGSVSLYIDEEYAIERGVDPAKLTRVEIPRDLLVSGTVQEVREYVALYLESHLSGTA